jgi:hypothetical protein
MLTREAEHLHHASTIAQLLASRIRDYLDARAAQGKPSSNHAVLTMLASVFYGDLDAGFVEALRELAQIEGLAELRLEIAAALRRAAETAPPEIFGTYHAFGRVLDPAHDTATARLILGAAH